MPGGSKPGRDAWLAGSRGAALRHGPIYGQFAAWNQGPASLFGQAVRDSCIMSPKFAAAQSGLRPRSFGEDARLPSRLLLQTHRGLHSAPPILSLNQW